VVVAVGVRVLVAGTVAVAVACGLEVELGATVDVEVADGLPGGVFVGLLPVGAGVLVQVGVPLGAEVGVDVPPPALLIRPFATYMSWSTPLRVSFHAT
jgi:hypothetical protein